MSTTAGFGEKSFLFVFLSLYCNAAEILGEMTSVCIPGMPLTLFSQLANHPLT